jgi:hypothetical protein
VPQAEAVSSVPAKSRIWQSLLLIAAALVVLAVIAGIWSGYSKIRIHNKQSHLPPGLVALWSGKGNAKDSVGGDNGDGRLQMVAVRKNLDLVWVWFYKDVAPTARFKGANPAK